MNVRRSPFPKYGDGLGLHRVAAIAGDLGIDLEALGGRAGVIVGSNGKGSVAAMSASLLAQAARPVGRFTSPHLYSIHERFWIDGADIADEELGAHWTRVLHAAEAYQTRAQEKVGGFEFLFLVAASWFQARACAFTIWEAGIGGRYDPVRLLRAPRVALTSLDLEHTALLGNTLEQIAFDKIDAAPEGARVFLPCLSDDLRARVIAYCATKRVAAEFVAPDDVFTPPLAGAHQRENMALAIALGRAMTALDGDAVRAGLKATRWPGRLETISEAPLAVVDVGHTPDAARRALEGFLAMAGARTRVLVCGASIDKNAEEMLAILAPVFPIIVAAQAPHKGRPSAEIAELARRFNPGAEILAAANMKTAHEIAFERAGPEGAIYAGGGLFLAIAFKATHQGRDPAALDFF